MRCSSPCAGHAADRASAFNVGGGPAGALSPLELVERVAGLLRIEPEVVPHDPNAEVRPGFVSDNRRFQNATGWAPRVGLHEGIATMCRWLAEPRGCLTPSLAAGEREDS